ncbi:fatty acyl-AMP ligase [Pedomonas mirosovicensis]|uniref:fatty acyl-AMP ligase n=1 Tax=Pedomonas mirosovicensis TaxID=2908641 RepID=UPI0021680187|nr:fatty acyl-AMP ligase [Pedomonas mirosovicensis]MCH8685229.1 fatty acyl-AMP ligase [Pedomonas mirosovicensis]
MNGQRAARANAAALTPTPTEDTLPRRYADFETFTEALDYAAQGVRGFNVYTARGDLKEVLPFAALREGAISHARRLMKLGVERGDRVALIAETSSAFMIAFSACAYATGLPVPLPLPTSFGGREGYVQQIRNQLSSSEPKVVLAPSGLIDLIREAADGLGAVFVGDWDAFAALPEADGELPQAHPDDVAYLQYSSGSTRFPHGVEVTHRAMLANCHGQAFHGTKVQPNDRCISWLPFYHDMGLVGCFLATLTSQVSTDLIPTDEFVRRPLTWLKLISENKGSTISYSPTFGYDITARRAPSDVAGTFDLSRWRVAGNGGDMIRPDVMQAFIDAFAPAGFNPGAFMPSYGLAEATVAISFTPVGQGIVTDLVDERMLSGDTAPRDPRQPVRYRAIVNCGKPLPDHVIEIRDEDDQILPERAIGRVLVKGPSIMKGYFRDPEATAACLSPDGWLDTGDMGYLLDGSLYIIGRAKDMIIINGKNHWPQDIEWAVEQLPGFKNGDIAAFAVTEANGEERPAVLVQCRASDPAERIRLREEIRAKVRQITGMNCIVELVPPRSLPRTSSGKLSRSKARQLYLSGQIVPLSVAA